MMKASDWVGTVTFAGFGVWLVLAPRSVIRFYSWFHGDRFRAPTILGVRIVGGLWALLVLFVVWRATGK